MTNFKQNNKKKNPQKQPCCRPIRMRTKTILGNKMEIREADKMGKWQQGSSQEKDQELYYKYKKDHMRLGLRST